MSELANARHILNFILSQVTKHLKWFIRELTGDLHMQLLCPSNH